MLLLSTTTTALATVATTRELKQRAAVSPAPPLVREVHFATGISAVYAKLKAAQAHAALRRLAGEDEREQQRRWAATHDNVGQDLYRLCASLGGAYVKVGQFFSTRPDLVPEQWCKPLGVLCDAVEPMDAETARSIAAEELVSARCGWVLRDWSDVPLGAASVAQVHSAVLEPTGGMGRRTQRWPFGWRRRMDVQRVAVKVRRPEAEQFFARDLAAVSKAAAFVQRFELSFDLLSCVEELRDRVDQELDLRIEYGHLVRTGGALRRATNGAIVAPRALLGTRRCLVTELCDGTPLSKLVRSQDRVAAAPLREAPSSAAVGTADEPRASEGAAGAAGGTAEGLPRLNPLVGRALRRGVHELYDAYGRMILCTESFHADPHPGNLLVPTELRRATTLAAARRAVPPPLRWLLPYAPPRLYLVDWGQCGGPTPVARRMQLATLFLELSEADERHFSAQPKQAARVATALRELGVVVSPVDDDVEHAELARGMFDLSGEVQIGGSSKLVEASGGGEGGGKSSSLDVLPKDLFLVLRVTQMLSGLGHAAEKAGAPDVGRLARAWRPHAHRARAES